MMKPPPVQLVALVFGALALIPFGSSAQASPVFIDDFSVTVNGGLLFADSFSDGIPPPSAPNFANGSPASYFVNGTLNESGGKVRLDTVDAQTSLTTTGIPVFIEAARLLTDVNPLDLTRGLKNDDTFSVVGLFDLTVPSLNGEAYGVRLTDVTGPNTSNDLLQLLVSQGGDGIDRVVFIRTDLLANSSTVFGTFLLDPAHDQIRLDLTRLSAGSDAITASFAYVDGGIAGPSTTFETTADIFHGENFTRGEFVSLVPVPEPSNLILCGVGLVGLVAGSWKRSRAGQPCSRDTL
jgi:hypothetical protein